MGRRLGVGVIGVHVRGRHAWEQILKLHPSVEVRVVSLYPGISSALTEGHTEADAREYAAFLGADYTSDYGQVLTRDDVHIVSLMTEPARTADLAEEVAAAGKHIVCDKPMTLTLAEAERVLYAVESAGVELLVTLSFRYADALRQARDTVAKGAIGRLLVANMIYLQGNGPLPGFTATPEYRERVGGGDFTTFAPYCIDYLLWVMDRVPVSVHADMGTFFYPDYREAGIEDLGHMVLGFSDGGCGYICAGRTSAPGSPYLYVDLTGTRGSIHVTEAVHAVYVQAVDGGIRPVAEPQIHAMIFDFVDAILDGRPSPIGARAARDMMAVLTAARESACTGHSVPM